MAVHRLGVIIRDHTWRHGARGCNDNLFGAVKSVSCLDAPHDNGFKVQWEDLSVRSSLERRLAPI